MNIAALAPDREAPSCRYRLSQCRAALEDRGIKLTVSEIPRRRAARAECFARAGQAEAVILHRKLLTGFDFSRLRRLSPRLTYDFDDAVLYRDSQSGRFFSRTRLRRFARQAARADLVIAGNQYLAEAAARFADRVVISPTPVDLADYPETLPASNPGTIGWMGTSSNFVYLRDLVPALRRVLKNRPGRRLLVVSDRTPDLDGLPFEFRTWSPAVQHQALTEFSLGLMPLRDDPWARGKCAYKVLQYFAAGLPVIASPVGMNRSVIREGTNGLLPDDEDSWVEALENLLRDPPARERLGRAGRSLVAEKYSLEAIVPRLAGLLKGET